jgi:neopullulanase
VWRPRTASVAQPFVLIDHPNRGLSFKAIVDFRATTFPPFSLCLSVKNMITSLGRAVLNLVSPHFYFVLIAFAISNGTAWPQATLPETPSTHSTPADAPVITKVEPPNWWIHLTPEVTLLLSGHNLEATQVVCNLPTLRVSRTQATADGDYLFVWVEIGTETKAGTAVCRVATPAGTTSFELPLAARTPTLGKFQGLSQEDVLYLIMPDRFANGDPTNDEPANVRGAAVTHDRSNPRAYHGGDLVGIREHLTYLKDLGVTTLWLTPVVKNDSPQDYHGYGAVDLYQIDPHLGTLKDYKNLIAAAHQQGMKVFFDIVPNHVGPRHAWVLDPPLPDWFHGTRLQHLDSFSPLKGSFYGKSEMQNIDAFESIVDPHMPASLQRNLTDGWFFGKLPDLNTENPVVARYLLQNAVWWAEVSGLDGYRIDTFPYVSRQFWAGWHAGLHGIYPNLTTIGEVFHPDPSVTSFFVGRQKRGNGNQPAIDTGLSTIFDFPMYFTLRAVLLSGAPVGRIADVLRHDSLYPHPQLLIPFFSNHDVPRISTMENSSLQKVKLAFALTLTLRGVPELYYGDEIGMPGKGDPDNRRDFPGGWSDDPKNAFTQAGRTGEQQEIFSYVQTLLRLRRKHPALQSGRLMHVASDDLSYCFLRSTEEERLLVVFNNSNEEHRVQAPLKDLLAGDAAGFSPIFGVAKAELTKGELQINMPAQSLSILVVN